jgi:four helix bundle protein
LLEKDAIERKDAVMEIKSYKDLKIWQQGIEITDKIYNLTDKFPSQEMYGLTSQIRRSAISIPSNIAEGFVRSHQKEYKQFLYIALGSCAELATQLIITEKRRYAESNHVVGLAEALEVESRMIMSLIKKLSAETPAVPGQRQATTPSSSTQRPATNYNYRSTR